MITGSSAALLATAGRPLGEQFLCERGLRLSPEKTTITPIADGVAFLGHTMRKYHGYRRLTPATQRVPRFLTKVRRLLRPHTATPAGVLIGLRTPLLRGWALYYRHGSSGPPCHRIDRAVFHALRHWAKRRHRHTSARWIAARYCRPHQGRQSVLAGEGEEPRSSLCHPAQLRFKRHVKIQKAAHPDDPAWELSVEKRLSDKCLQHLDGHRGIRMLWQEQHGRCPVCHTLITAETGWHNHHILWRSLGGTDRLENRVGLHPNCHRQVHGQRLTVTKPRPARGAREA
jgi:RNA-directed DNA polymerase